MAGSQYAGAHRSQEAPIQPETLAEAFARTILDKKGFDVAILDMRSLVDYTDLFVICSARNRRQVQAIADELRKIGKERFGLPPQGVEGREPARWILVDFGSVMVHVFDQPVRGFYDLDGLWRDAPRLPVPDAPAPEEDEAFGSSDWA